MQNIHKNFHRITGTSPYKVTTDLHITYCKKTGETRGWCLTKKNGNFSIKSHAVAIHYNRLAEAILIDSQSK